MGISPSGVSPRPANLGNPITFWVLGQIETDRINFGLNMKRMRRTGSFGSDWTRTCGGLHPGWLLCWAPPPSQGFSPETALVICRQVKERCKVSGNIEVISTLWNHNCVSPSPSRPSWALHCQRSGGEESHCWSRSQPGKTSCWQFANICQHFSTPSCWQFDNWTGQIGQSLSSSNGRRCFTVTDECCSIASMWIEQMKRKFAQTLSMTQMGFLLKNKHYPLSECCIDGNLSNDSMYGKYIFLKWISTVPID